MIDAITMEVIAAVGGTAATAAVAAAIEAYRTRRMVEQHDSAVFGDDDRAWDGLVERSKRHEERLDDIQHHVDDERLR